jgi:hypothetical protein
MEIWRGQLALEVGQGLPFPLVKLNRNHVNQDVPAPTVLKGGAEIPFPNLALLHAVEEDHVVTPRQFCSKLLQNWLIRPSLREGPHITEATGAEALYTGKLAIFAQPLEKV